jgi:hypothetical protein
MTAENLRCTAFAGARRIASGSLREVALAVKTTIERNPNVSALIFDDATGRAIDLDLRGSDDEAIKRLASHPIHGEPAPSELGSRGPGRPKLGVVAREVTLLPRHWHWLNAQPGGASVALRKLVDEARRANGERDQVRQAQEVTYRFMSAIAGNEPGFEEATRALFAGNQPRFDAMIERWPADVQAHVAKLAESAFPPQGTQESGR